MPLVRWEAAATNEVCNSEIVLSDFATRGVGRKRAEITR
jgi:hypothetical protein